MSELSGKRGSDSRQPWPDRPRPGNFEHQGSDHEELTHADCPPYKAGRSATWESVLSRLRPLIVHSTSAQKHTVPAQTNLAPADGPPSLAGQSAQHYRDCAESNLLWLGLRTVRPQGPDGPQYKCTGPVRSEHASDPTGWIADGPPTP
jgi:hypothetical protein